MQVKFDFKIFQVDSDTLKSTVEVENEIISNSYSGNQFLIESTDRKSVEIKNTTGLLSFDIFDIFNVDPSNLAFIHIQLNDTNMNYSQTNDKKFQLFFDGNLISDTSHFTLINLDNFNVSNISVTVPAFPDLEDCRKLSFIINLGVKDI